MPRRPSSPTAASSTRSIWQSDSYGAETAQRATRLWADDRLHARLPEPGGADPALDRVPEVGDAGLAQLLERGHGAAGGGFLPVDVWSFAGRGGGQRALRAPRRVGAGALSLSGKALR